MKITNLPLQDVKPYEKNPRKNDQAVDKVANSIREYGFRQPIVVDEKNVIIIGHTRYKAAKKLRLKEIPVHVATGLTPEKVSALRIADNRTAEEAEWDNSLLTEELADLITAGFDTSLTGFDADEIDKLLAPTPEEADAAARVDKAAELQKAWKTAPGQLWLLGPHRLLIGDSTKAKDVDRLMAGEKADLVHTDPPYGVSYQSEATGSLKNDELRQDALVGLLKPAICLMVDHAKDTAAFYIWHASSTRRDFEWAMDAAGLEEKQYITWIKESLVLGRADYHWQTEPCFYAAKRGHQQTWHGKRDQTTAWRITRVPANGELEVWLDDGAAISDGTHSVYLTPKPPKGNKRLLRVADGQEIRLIATKTASDAWQIRREPHNQLLHPTTKPTELCIRAVTNSSAPGDLVLDLFGGSGSTLLACHNTGRRCRTMELDPKFAAVILERYREASQVQPTLEEKSK